MRDARIRLDTRSELYLELKSRVDAWFAVTGLKPRDVPAMYRKSAIIIGWWLASYVLFLSAASSWLAVVGLAVSCGLAMAGLGMSVQHDGGHRAYSANPKLNRAAACWLDLMGSSSYIWNVKHNVLHHTYPNVVGADDDIDIGALARMAPDSPRRGFHRWQHLYMWPLYGFISIKWHWIDDFRQLMQGRVGDTKFPPPRGKELLIFVAGKLLFFGWALLLPLWIMPLGYAIALYLVSQMVQGLTLAATFQLAHCVEEAEYLSVPEQGERVDVDFARLQLSATVDFATDNRLLTWYMGGLNFQAVHHLFPRVCHVHYPAILRIVAEVCGEHEVPYAAAPSLGHALRSHYRWLRSLGAPA